MNRAAAAIFLLLTACQTTTAKEPIPIAPSLRSALVGFESGTGERISGYLFRPPGDAPQPAVVMLHGCSGALTKSGRLKSRETAWRDILLEEGYVVLVADSFAVRGHRSICRISLSERPVEPDRQRPHDAFGALRWLQSQPFVRPDRIALAGWSNGAMTMLWTVMAGAPQRPSTLTHDFRAAIGFYPGCIKIRRERPGYRSAIPMLLQIGADDDWTWPKPCLDLAAQGNTGGGAPIEVDAYADAYHSFDSPSSGTREITVSDGRRVHVGTHHEARARAIGRVKQYLRAYLAD